MKVKNKIFIIALILSLILSVTAVAAADDITFDQSDINTVSDETDIELSQDDSKLAVSDDEDDSNSLGEGENQILKENANHTVEGSDFSNIQQAISASSEGDTIFLDGKTYNGSGPIKVNKNGLTIIGGSGEDESLIATLDAEGLTRIMEITASDVVIKGIKFINANFAGDGGAVLWSGANGKLTDSIFSNNHANRYAGAIYWTGVGGSVEKSSFENNTAYGNGAATGGAIFWDAVNATIKDSNFKNNSANYGGAIHIAKENSTIISSVFEANEAILNSGGALRLFGDNVEIRNSRFIDNRAASAGGAIYSINARNSIYDSNFTGNYANIAAGVCLDTNTPNSIIDNCNFVNNTLHTGNGAAIYWKGSNGILINSNFTDNRAGDNGGAIRWDGVNATITHCNFKNNTAIRADLVSGSGGAILIYSTAAEAKVSECNFIDNTAHASGGAILWSGVNGTIANSYFENNFAYNGGAIYWASSAVGAKLHDCNFHENVARNIAGAVRFDSINSILNNCNFTKNQAYEQGGAVTFAQSALNGTLTNCNFSDNSVVNFGGAVTWFGINGTLRDCDFTNNSASNGGALNWDTVTSQGYIPGANGTLINCNFLNNEAANSGGAIRWNALNGTVIGCEFIGNVANYAGSMIVTARSSNSRISDCKVVNNTARTSTAGIRLDGCNNITLSNCSFINNKALTGGSAGAYVTGKNVMVKDSKFINNSAAESAGAIIWNGVGATGGVLTNCEFVNNSANSGGAVRWDGSKAIITDCDFIENYAVSNSGALLISSENATLSGCNFIRNSAGGQGAVSSSGANANISNCNFAGNFALNNNGAMAISGANSTIKNSSFTGNNANLSQGALGIAAGGVGTLIDGCSFEDNSATNNQGAVVVDAANVTLTNSSFDNNRAGNYGGAISWRAVNGTMDNCNFTNNFANISGGAAYFNGNAGNATLSNCEFKNNLATDSGGSIRWDASNGTISNSNFTNNSAMMGGAIHSVGDGLKINENGFADNRAGDAGSVFWIDGDNNQITGNEIHTSSSDVAPIYATDVSGLIFDGDKSMVHHASVIIDVEDRFIGHIGKVIDIPIHVHDDLGIAMVGDVTINGYGTKALVGGKAIFEIDLPEEVTSFSLVVIYDKLSKEIKVDVVNNDHPIDEILQPNDHVDDIVVKLPRDATGNVTVTVNGKNYTADVSNGEAIISINDLENGIYPATVFYSGDRKYPSMSKIMHVVIENSNINPVTQMLLNEDISVIYSGTGTYRVLVTKHGEIVGAGESVTFNFNGKNTIVKTDARGYATFSFAADVKVGTHKIKATYFGKSVTNNVKVTQVIKASDKKVKKSKKVTKVKITLNKVNGKFLSKKVLKIKFNKKTYKVKTNKKGVATWKVKKSMLKKLKVGKKVKYTVTYGKATLTKKLIIKR